jgi:hypothetical protein
VGSTGPVSAEQGVLRGVDSFTAGGVTYFRVDSLVAMYWPDLRERERAGLVRRANSTRLLTPVNVLGLVGLTHSEALLALVVLHPDQRVRAEAFSEQARRGVLHGVEGALYLAVLRSPGATREELVAEIESQAHRRFDDVMSAVGGRMTRREDGQTGWRVGDPDLSAVDDA